MLIFMLIPEVPAEEHHAKNSVDTLGISMIKYLDTTSISFHFDDSAYVVYSGCSQSLKIGVSLIKPRLFTIADI